MDTMIQSYMEETEDMLQRAEECIIRLEMEYSPVDVNELFRIAHTIKGSSHMVGYEDIGNLMHKIEDMLDCARNGSILFDQSIVSLCFEGLDTVKKMLQFKKEPGSLEIIEGLINGASRISEMVEVFIRVNKKEEEKTVVIQPEMGLVSSLLSRKPIGKNKFYISFVIEEDAPMVSPVLMIILNSVEDVGTLVYSSVGDSYFSGGSSETEIKVFDIILSTDIDEAELYTYFALFYVAKINITDLSRSKLEDNDYCFNDNDNSPYMIILKVLIKLYQILFSHQKDMKTFQEEQNIIESLHGEAVKAFSNMKNNKISTIIKSYNEFYTQILKTHEEKLNTDEKSYLSCKTQIAEIIKKLYNDTKGRYMFSIFKSEKDGFIHGLRKFIGMVNKSSTVIILVDISKLSMLKENDVKDLIEMKKQLLDQDIEMSMIVEGTNSRRIVNIFDSIKPVEEFKVFKAEFDAILEMFLLAESSRRISKKIKGEQYEE